MRETWKDVVGYEGLYRVSDLGRIASLHRKSANSPILGAKPNKRGYPQATLTRAGRETLFQVHALVLRAFRGPPTPGQECRHLDGNSTNCALSNLAWGTHLENIRDKYRHGTMPRGETASTAKLTEAQVKAVRESPLGCVRAAEAFGVSRSCIKAIRRGITWKHVASAGRSKVRPGRLTDGQVRDIRASNLLQREVGARYGLSQDQVSRIRSGEAYASVQ